MILSVDEFKLYKIDVKMSTFLQFLWHLSMWCHFNGMWIMESCAYWIIWILKRLKWFFFKSHIKVWFEKGCSTVTKTSGSKKPTALCAAPTQTLGTRTLTVQFTSICTYPTLSANVLPAWSPIQLDLSCDRLNNTRFDTRRNSDHALQMIVLKENTQILIIRLCT